MGERSYEVIGEDLATYSIHFSEFTAKDEDDFGCLCTFPGNDIAYGKTLSMHKLQALALLGAAVVLCAHESDYLSDTVGQIDEETFSVVLPYAIPKWIRDEIKRLLPND